MQAELLFIVAAALVPPLLVALVLARTGLPRSRAWVAAGVAFAWGAVVATTLAQIANDAIGAHATAALGAAGARGFVPVVVGPLVEEVVKAMAFLAVACTRARVLDRVRGAVAIGAITGLGFSAAENVGYYTLAAVQAGWAGVGRALWVRGIVQLPNHALFTAVVGVGVGWARRQHRPTGILAAGLVLAVALHAAWNGLVSGLVTDTLCNAPASGAACAAAPDAADLVVRVPALVLAFVFPIAVAMRSAVRRLV